MRRRIRAASSARNETGKAERRYGRENTQNGRSSGNARHLRSVLEWTEKGRTHDKFLQVETHKCPRPLQAYGERRPAAMLMRGIFPVVLSVARRHHHAGCPRPLRQIADNRTVYVTAVDDKGAPVPGLTSADFAVKEDGKTRTVVAVAPSTAPLTIALMIDDDGLGLQSMREAPAAFAERLRGRASLALFTTNGRTLKVQDYTESFPALVGAINKVYARNCAGAFLVDGIVGVTRDFGTREVRRPVIMSVGVEGPDFSQSQPADVVADLLRTRTQLVHGPAGPAGDWPGQRDVSSIAESRWPTNKPASTPCSGRRRRGPAAASNSWRLTSAFRG